MSGESNPNQPEIPGISDPQPPAKDKPEEDSVAKYFKEVVYKESSKKPPPTTNEDLLDIFPTNFEDIGEPPEGPPPDPNLRTKGEIDAEKEAAKKKKRDDRFAAYRDSRPDIFD